MRTLQLLIAIAVLLFSTAARAQVGPPIPSPDPSPAPAAAGPSTDFPQLDPLLATNPAGINPLQMLDAAGRAIPGGAEPGKGGLSTAVNILVVLTVITLAPSIMLMTTCFVRIL